MSRVVLCVRAPQTQQVYLSVGQRGSSRPTGPFYASLSKQHQCLASTRETTWKCGCSPKLI
eukprot:scaffold94938_cov57-Phaeocystis_antarctica.AAC.2